MSEAAPESTTVTVEGAEKTEVTETPKAQPNPDVERLQAALDKEREARKAADKRAKENDAYRAKVEEIELANKTEIERAVENARKEGESAALVRANAKLVAAEARALAAQAKFRDATDAVRFLDLAEVIVAEDGSVDVAALGKQLEQLAKDKPYLLIDQRPTRPQGDIGQGPRPVAVPEPTPGMGRLRQAYAEATPK